ncbi:MAG: ABC transporter permease, partial [Candidatus Marinimicrobia bacterium]|nr:ABC transporter permease [Candidatus Neomarinimicrobiota bacterium]
MNAAKIKKANEIFQLVVELPVEELESFLTTHCAGDTDLRAFVEQLLSHDAAGMGEFMCRPVFMPTPEETQDPEQYVPKRVGRYAIIRKIGEALWPNLSVALISLFLTLAIALPIGIYSAVRQGSPFDRTTSTGLYMLYSVPSYVMGMLLILFFGVKLDWLPFRGMRSDNFAELGALGQWWDLAQHYMMITFCFTFANLAYYSRFVRQNLL